MKFTFDVSKCDRIFDELLRLGHIKITHVIPPLEELRRRAYCKFHNSHSHATNDCNVFRRQIQSAMNIDGNGYPIPEYPTGFTRYKGGHGMNSSPVGMLMETILYPSGRRVRVRV